MGVGIGMGMRMRMRIGMGMGMKCFRMILIEWESRWKKQKKFPDAMMQPIGTETRRKMKMIQRQRRVIGISKRIGMMAMIVLSLLCVESVAKVANVVIPPQTSRKIQLDRPFGFEEGGTVKVGLDVQPKGEFFYFVMMDTDQWNKDALANANTSQLRCQMPSERRFEFKDQLSVEFRITRKNLYYFGLINCKRDRSVRVTGEMTLLNPNNVLMSLQDIPYVNVFLMMSFLYILLGLVWQYLYMRYRPVNALTNIPNVLRVCLLFKIVEMVMSFVFYDTLMKTGVEHVWLRTFVLLVGVIAEGCLMAAMLLISYGWLITRDSLEPYELKVTWGTFLVYAILNVLRVLCPQNSTLCSTYGLAYWIVKFVITLRILLAINGNMEILRTTAVTVDWPQTVPEQIKLSLFNRFRSVFLVYLLAPVLIIFFEFSVFDWQQNWTLVLLEQLVTFGIYCRVLSVFQPSADNASLFDHHHVQ
eukprot:TRINITY_DN1572_c0_g1_i1.p1 TRINITY_DN1572_c0_g1~~TRINITY_DN1572_c0_g1_i1.p1  ORF type:complete len:473 (-),score=48.01 TRINITY_DN1572_c0_g1_i1:79-1497(-)